MSKKRESERYQITTGRAGDPQTTETPPNAPQAPNLTDTRKSGEKSHPLNFALYGRNTGDGVNIRRNTDGDRARQTPRSPANRGLKACQKFLIFFEKK